jgi:hypothetical protein
MPVFAQRCPAAWHFATAFGLFLLASMHALTFGLQSAARAAEPSAIKNAIVVTIPPDFRISFLRNLLKAIDANSARHHAPTRIGIPLT